MKKQLFKLLLVYLCLTNLPLKSASQFINPYTSSADSLKYLLNNTQKAPDTNRVMTLNRLARRKTSSNPDTAVLLLKQSKLIADKLNFFHGQLRYYLDIGNIYSSLVTMPEKFYADSMAIIMAKQYKGFDYLGSAYNAMGCYYKIVENHDSATKYFLLTKNEYEKDTSTINFLPIAYANLSTEYVSLGDYKKALYYGNKAIEICRKRNIRTGRFDVALNNTANAYKAMGNLDSAAILYKEELALADEMNEPNNKIGALGNYAGVFAMQHKYLQMLDLMTQNYKLAIALNNPETVCDALIGMAEALCCNKRYKEAKAYAQQAIQCNEKNAIPENYQNLYRIMSNIAFAEGNIDMGLDYSQKSDSVRNVINNKHVLSFTKELETKYQVASKDLALQERAVEANRQFWIIVFLISTLLAGVVISTISYYVFKQKKKLEQLEALGLERQRIAADMHDDMGAGISRIRFLGEGIKHILPNQKVKEDVDTMIELSDDLVDKMNEIIWTLNTGDEPLQEIFYYIRSQCSQMVSNAGIGFESNIPDNLPTIIYTAAQKRNIYLAIKEAVHNALKHAQATQISLNVVADKNISITIADNGKGFDIATAKGSGNGLYNYEKRMQALSGHIAINTSDTGTEVCLIIPV